MATVSSAPTQSVNSAPATASSPAGLSAVALAVLSKIAGNESFRDSLEAGSAHVCNLTISGDVDGLPLAPCQVKSTLTIGHDSQRASSSNPPLATLIGNILAKLNKATRDAVLRDLPADYTANGNELPAVDAEIEAATDAMLKTLRASKQTSVRGSVACKYSLEAKRGGSAAFRRAVGA